MAYYDKFQLIAYHIPTGGEVAKVGAGARCEGLQYLPEQLGDLSDDAAIRLTRLAAVVEKAVALSGSEVEESPSTLKIFMAPEFYLRPSSAAKSRSYSEEDKKIILQVLGQMFKDEVFEHWVFVLGTIIWNKTGKSLLEDAEVKMSHVMDFPIVYNTAIVVANRRVKTVDKLNYADVDQIDAKYRANVANPELIKAIKEPSGIVTAAKKETLELYFLVAKANNWSRAFFRVGQLYFGIEICADHDMGVLAEAYADWLKTMPPDEAPKLDFQLLTACGMSINPERLLVGRGRYVLRMDGAADPDPTPHSEIQAVADIKKNGHRIMTDWRQDKDGWSWWNNGRAEQDLQSPLAIDTSGIEVQHFTFVYTKGKEKVECTWRDLEKEKRGSGWDLGIDESKTCTAELNADYPQKLVVYKPQLFLHVAPAADQPANPD